MITQHPDIFVRHCKFIFGLKDEIQEELLKRMPSSLEEAFIISENLDRAKQNWYLNTKRIGSLLGDYSLNKPTYEPMEIDKIELKKLTDKEKSHFIREGRCFKCRKVGHISRECPGKKQVEHFKSEVSSYNKRQTVYRKSEN